MLNLFQLLHYHSDKASVSDADALRDLFVVCDKYDCAAKLQDYFSARLEEHPLPSVDTLLICALTRNKRKFANVSEEVLRMPQNVAKGLSSAVLEPLLPNTVLGRLSLWQYIEVND